MNVRFAKLIGLFAILLCAGHICQGQSDGDVAAVMSRGGANCEEVAAIFDSFLGGIKSSDRVILLSYRGKKDTRLKIEEQRIEKAYTYMVEHFPDSKNVGSHKFETISAIGRGRTEYGRLDFYVRGVLQLRINFQKNMPLAISPCYSE